MDINLAKQELNIINKIIEEIRAVNKHQETMKLHTELQLFRAQILLGKPI